MCQILTALTGTNSFNPHIFLKVFIILILPMRKMRQKESLPKTIVLVNKGLRLEARSLAPVRPFNQEESIL